MNYKQEALRAIQVLGQKNPELGLGDLLFTCFQKTATEKNKSLNFLRDIPDEDLYSSVESLLNKDFKDSTMTDEEWELWTTKKQ